MRTAIVSRSHATIASFIARADSWMVTTSRKNSCAAAGYGVCALRLGISRVCSVCVPATAGSEGTTANGL